MKKNDCGVWWLLRSLAAGGLSGMGGQTHREVEGVQEVNFHIDTHNMTYAHVCEGRNTQVTVNMHMCRAPPQQAGCMSSNLHARTHTHTETRACMCPAVHIHPGVVAFVLVRRRE